ncbi:minor extracellular serine protease Vpr [Croceifilum oryzae]|uniref:Minor extracellular serine protease Vpr n=1 Tax=Croceifilum oryzae TaxID=1553429 RepID=A0AAJ1TLQ3_9BACL|nr:minor extracellular serine protease Vpr [Croceifilum oryzae]
MKKSIIASLSFIMTVTCMSSYSHAEVKNTSIPQQYTGKGVKVAIIDSGIDREHPDLKKNYLKGYDFIENDHDPQDTNGHGTHVAGIVKKTAPDVSLLVYRVGDGKSIPKAIDRAIADGAQVINISMEGEEDARQAAQRAINKSIPVVVANGNSGPDLWTVNYLSSAPEVISVGNLKQRGISQILLSAPGIQQDIQYRGIYSPAPKPGKYPIVDLSALTLEAIQKEDLKNKIVILDNVNNMNEALLQELHKKEVVAMLVADEDDRSEKQGIQSNNKNKAPAFKIPLSIITKKEIQILEKAAKEQKIITISHDSEERIYFSSSHGPTVES